MPDPFLSVRGLSKEFFIGGGMLGLQRSLRAVDAISFDVQSGETLGLVGESGSGKSTAARLILRLLEPSAGRVLIDGVDVMAAGGARLRDLRRHIQIVFQDPLSSLNPRMAIGTSVMEPLRFHGIGGRRLRAELAHEMLEMVGLHASEFERYPHDLSGGQCQRVAIARALVLRPKLVIFDEAVSALDVSVRAQILRLLLDMQERFCLTYIFISHDLSVVKRMSNRIAVMYLGRIVELAESETLLAEPLHPYTARLISAVLSAHPGRRLGDLPVSEEERGAPSRSAAPSELVEVRPGHYVAKDAVEASIGARRDGE